ncbi:MAG: hypothetical protein J0M15_08755 [Deltaproteobacteria bacterium]|jgi:hypothetical protein|nr:hypothetical protein [Deltaproteobacteria bacterium]
MRIAFIFLVFYFECFAVEVKSIKEGSQISFLVSDISFPENFEKSLKSGLSNIYILKQSVWKNGQLVFASDIAVKVIFDLWDELYFVTKEVGSNNSVDKYSHTSNILEKLKSYKFSSTLKASDFKKSDNYEVKVTVILDPITKEKQKKIKTWLAENQVNLPGISNRAPTSKQTPSNDQGASAFDTVKTSVFNKVLNSELDSEIVEGAWIFESDRIKVSGKDFENEK